MVDALPQLQPAECALLLIGQQAGLAFGVGSTDCQILLNDTVALARTATAFELPKGETARMYKLQPVRTSQRSGAQ
jgi:hypothetical protein